MTDPVIRLAAEKRRSIVIVNHASTGEASNRALDKQIAVDRALIRATPTTLAGAAAGLTIAKYELETFVDLDCDDGRHAAKAAAS
jgi:hypothetical protein